jgi:hypothetical protein
MPAIYGRTKAGAGFPTLRCKLAFPIFRISTGHSGPTSATLRAASARDAGRASDWRIARIAIMYNNNRSWCILPRMIMAAILVSTPTASLAQSEYPSRAIKIIVPLQAGSIPDTVPQILADRLTARWRQPVR